MPLVKKFWRTRSPKFTFAANYVRGERPLEVGRFLPANEFSGEPFASSRRSAREPGRTPPNSGERSAYSGERPAEFGGLSVLANRWRVRAEFARVRSSSREFARVRGERQFAGYTAQNSTIFPCVRIT